MTTRNCMVLDRYAVESGGAMQHLPLPPANHGSITGVTGVILAGGASSRMKSNKALLPAAGGRFIELIYRQMCSLFTEVLLVTNTPECYNSLPCRKVPDQFPGRGPLAGIHAGLLQSKNSRAMVVACDMPYLHEELIRYIATCPTGEDVIIPESANGLEPLHALYSRNCLPLIEAALLAGHKRIVSFFSGVAVRRISQAEVVEFDPDCKAFQNINTPEDYYRLRQEQGADDSPVATLPHDLRRAQG